MLNGEQYLKSLSDGRRTFFQGVEVTDLPGHPAFAAAATWVATSYDRWYDPAPGATNPVMSGPRSREDMRLKASQLRQSDIVCSTTYQSLMTLLTAAPKVAELVGREYADRIFAYYQYALREDLRLTECITDAKGDRSLPPSQQPDEDAYVRIVERTADGIVIRGAKLHITGASLGHELVVMPTKRMKPGEEDHAVACAVPVASPGVKIVNTSYAPEGDDRDFPITRHESMPDGFVIFEDVFVPNERVFLDGQIACSAVFAHSLGLWERLGGVAGMADDADLLVGLGDLIAEANGLRRTPHITEKLAELTIYATLIRAGLEAAVNSAHATPEGFYYPDELYTNAAKYYGAANYNLMVRHLHDIAGGAVLTAPSIGDLENPETGEAVARYMRGGNGVDGETRLRLFHAIRDLTADRFGGWNFVTNIQSGGGLFAQRLVTRKHYDIERARDMARRAAGLSEGAGLRSQPVGQAR